MASVPDPRSAHGRRHPLGAILTLAVCGMLCGTRSLYAIAQWGRDQGSTVAQALGFTRATTPCVATLHLVFRWLDCETFEVRLGAWFQEQGLKTDEALAVDGKARPCGASTGKGCRASTWWLPTPIKPASWWPNRQLGGKVKNSQGSWPSWSRCPSRAGWSQETPSLLSGSSLGGLWQKGALFLGTQE